MKCFLHIGTEKTATTTIQNFFNINRKKMLENGFIYTKEAGKANNRGLPVAAFNLHRRDDFTNKKGLDTDDKLAFFQRQTIANLIEEIEAIKKDYPNTTTIVFSSEHIQSRLTDIKEIRRLKEALHRLGVVDTCVVVYLRRPAEIASSLYSTAVRLGSCSPTPPPPNNPYWNNVCNHKETIEKFSSVFGESAIIPRLFGKHEFVNGSIIDDILYVIGIPHDSYDIPTNANVSLSSVGVNVLRRLNKTIPAWIDNRPNEVRANLVSYIEKHLSGSKYTMPNTLYEEYDSAFQESNEWVRLNYFYDKEILFPPRIQKEAALYIPDSEVDRIAEFISEIWNDKQKNIIDLTMQMHSDGETRRSFLSTLFGRR